MNAVMLGLPAAGKGTQAQKLEERTGSIHISTGSMFREAMRSGGELGDLARRYIDAGQLVPDEVTVQIVKARLKRADVQENGFLLDGFPRTVPQAEDLDALLADLGFRLDWAINIKISEAEAIKRVAGRRVCEQCGTPYQKTQAKIQDGRCLVCSGTLIQRTDDNEATARQRLHVYMLQTHPVIAYYRDRGVLVDVPGEQPIDWVFEAIWRGVSGAKVPPSNEVTG